MRTVFFLLMVIALGCGENPATTNDPKSTEKVFNPELLVLDIPMFVEDYRRNPTAADLKYKERRVRLTMKGQLHQWEGKTTWIKDGAWVKEESRFNPKIEVIFTFADDVAKMNPDKEYTVKGFCEGLEYNVIQISNARLVTEP